MNPFARLRTLAAALTVISLVASTFSAAAAQTERWYEVEIIVFADRTKTYAEQEVWPDVLPPLHLERAAYLDSAGGQPRGAASTRFRSLAGAELRLHWAYKKLQASSRFEPLVHLGWRQPAMPRDSATPVSISPSAGAEATVAGGPLPRVDGTVALKLGRYLHLEADLRYVVSESEVSQTDRFPAVPAAAGSLAGVSGRALNDGGSRGEAYRLVESRRVRSGELHYFDHPMFGVIALVTPYTPSK